MCNRCGQPSFPRSNRTPGSCFTAGSVPSCSFFFWLFGFQILQSPHPPDVWNHVPTNPKILSSIATKKGFSQIKALHRLQHLYPIQSRAFLNSHHQHPHHLLPCTSTRQFGTWQKELKVLPMPIIYPLRRATIPFSSHKHSRSM